MAGRPGSARFGTNPPIHTDKTNEAGISHVEINEQGETQVETHYMYNENLGGRRMGSTQGDAPESCYDCQDRQADYMCNHDGFIAGNARLMNLDERKVLDNKIASVAYKCADDMQDISGSRGMFDGG